MKDIFGNETPIIEGHEQAFWVLGACIFVSIIFFGLQRHWKDVQKIMEARKSKPVLRDFHDRDDPYQDDNNFGRQ